MAWFRKRAPRQAAATTGTPPAAPPAAPPAHTPPPRRWARRCLVLFPLLLLATLAGLFLACFWAFQTEAGHAWLLKTVNAALAGRDGGPSLRLTRLEGSVPADFVFGLEAADGHGVWLTAPENHLVWDWRALPGAVRIETAAIVRPTLSRLPDLPPAPEPEQPSPPLTLKDVQTLLGEFAHLFREPPFWLPEVSLAATVEGARFPAALLGGTDASAVAVPAAAPEVAAPPTPAPPAVPATGLLADVNLSVSLSADAGARLEAHARLAGADGREVRLAALGLQQAELAFTAAVRSETATPGLAATAEVEAALHAPKLAVADLPPDLLGARPTLRLALEARGVGDAAGAPAVSLRGPDLDAGRVALQGEGSWQGGQGWSRSELDGPLALRLAATLAPGAAAAASDGDPLSPLKAPARLILTAGGALPRPSLDLRLDCAELAVGGHRLEGLALAVTGKELALPLDAAFPPAEETAIDLDLGAKLDGHALNAAGRVFYSAAPGADAGRHGDLAAGVRDLRLTAAGVAGEGAFTALLPARGAPALDGGLRLSVKDWGALSALVPGYALDGDAAVELALKALSPARELPDAESAASQEARLAWRVPRLTVTEAGGADVVRVRGLTGEAQVADLFRAAVLDARLDLEEAHAAAMRLGARIRADGPLAGPLTVRLASSGDVTSRLEGVWEPGQVLLRVLDARADLPATEARSKAARLGLRLERPARFRYGAAGIGVDSLDVALTPSGRISARGGLAPDKLDLGLHIAGLELKPWSTLAPALPEGAVELRADLGGSPARPAGRFRLGVSGLHLPGSPLAPLAFALTGGIEPTANGNGTLSARLELPQASLRALGGDTASIAARLPLRFGPDGIPKPDMRGPLSARVRWNGALGPLWSLVPTADRRLNGRLALNADASGTLEAPRIRGGVRVDQGRFEDLLLGVLLTDITLRLDLDERGGSARGGLPGRMRLALSASDGRGGKAAIAGSGALNGDDLDIRATIDHLRPLRRRDVHIALSGKAGVTGSVAAPDVAGEIIINQGEFLLNNISLGGSVTTLPISAAPRPAAAAPAPAPRPAPAVHAPEGSLDIRIRMLPRFSVEGRGLTSLWQADLRVSGTPAAPLITGSVNAVKGNFDFLGKNFALTRGVVTFAGGSLSDPLLDIELTNETPDLTAHILITGTVSKMKLALTSEPNLPRDDILSHVLFGRSVNELGRLEALQLAGAVAQLAGFGSGGGGVLDFTKKALGVDVLRLGTSNTGAAGQPGDESAGGTTLEMGKYLTDSIYMGVQQGMKPDSTAFIIQLELTPRTSLEVRTEQQNTWGGLKWKYNY